MPFNSTNASFAHEALAASQQAVRQAVATSTDPQTLTMTGVVISQPLPLSNEDVRNFVGDLPAGAAAATPSNNIIGRFFFKVRLLSTGAFSPHEYLTNPCEMTTATDTTFDCIADLIALHTTAISVGGYNGTRPKVGDHVEIELHKLTKGRSFWYNIQTATFKSILDGSVQSSPAARELSTECANLATMFEHQDMSLLGSGTGTGTTMDPNTGVTTTHTPDTGVYLPTNTAITNGGLPDHNLIGIATAGHRTQPRLLKEIVEDWNELARAFNAHFESEGWKLGAWGDRTFDRQVELKQKELNGTGNPAARPGSSDHGWGVAVDMHYYDANGNRHSKDQGMNWDGRAFLWLKENAGTYMWMHPSWAWQNGSKPEQWHWESTKKDRLIRRNTVS